MALAGRVIASHYAEPLERSVIDATELRQAPAEEAPLVREMRGGEAFEMLDDSLGWAWGYAKTDGRVGYIRSDDLA